MESTTHDRSLCADIMIEILTRSSLETIACCRILSKECNSLTYEQTFKNLLGQRTNTTSGFFLQSLYKGKYSSMLLPLSNDGPHLLPGISLDFLPCYAKIEASTRQGIMLFRYDEQIPRVPQFYVCKPTTRQCQRIPSPKNRYQTEATGMIVVRTKPLHYKIVRLSEPKHCSNFEKQPYQDRSLRCELFDSQTFKWKQLPQVNLPLKSYFSPWNGSVLARGSLHWLTSRKTILAFQENNESWRLFSIPHLEKHDYTDFNLIEYGGKLGFICMGGGGSFMEVWVMECYEQKTWYKTQSLDLEFYTGQIPYATLIGYYAPGIVVMKDYKRVVVLNPKDASSVMMKLNYDFNLVSAFQFESDFEITDLPSHSRFTDFESHQFAMKFSKPYLRRRRALT